MGRIIKANPRRIAEGMTANAARNCKGVSYGGSPLADGGTKGDPDPADCGTCGKAGKQLVKLRGSHDWECSHIECPSRRRCWSQGIDAPRTVASMPPKSNIDKLFDER